MRELEKQLLLICTAFLISIPFFAQQKTSVDSAYKAIAPKLFNDAEKKDLPAKPLAAVKDSLAAPNLNIDISKNKVNTETSNPIKSESLFYADIDKIRTEYNIPELAYAVIYNDTVTVENVIGYKRLAQKVDSIAITIPAEPLDLFHIGSNTKAITAYLIMKLAKNNILKLNTKLIEVFPDFKGVIRAEFDNITIENLLSHRAGVQVFDAGEDFKRMPIFKGTLIEKRKAFSKWVLKFQRIVNKAKTFTYSNAGYTILASIIEAYTKENFESYAAKTMQADFGVALQFGWPNNISNNQPWGHWLLNDSLVSLSPEHPYHLDSLFSAAGDGNMSLSDYTKFIKEQMRGLNGNSSLLSQKEFEYMHYAYPEYALGWGNFTNKDNHISAHDGSAGTFYAHAILIKEKKIAIVILSNSGVTKSIDGIYKTRDFLIKKYLK
jgi:D-alanyl-D-alanine carboxypeptidase